MGKLYDKSLFFNYINGNEIDEKVLNELEDNCEFMMEVIKYTKDKNMYNLCSSNVKNNYTFVKFIVETFKDDMDFIIIVANNYLSKSNNDDINFKELVILVNNIISNKHDNEFFKIQSKAFYESTKVEMQILLNKNIDIDTWFSFVETSYDESPIIIDYFAKQFIIETFFKNENYSFEELIHKQFKSFSELEKQGINNYLINYIKNSDYSLATYITYNLDLLSDIKKELNRVEKNWENYMDVLNKRRIDIFYQEVYKYIEQKQYVFDYSNTELIDYVIKKLNLEEIFYKYDNNEEFLNEFDIETSIQEDDMDINELKCLRYITNLAKSLFKSDVIDNTNNDYNNEEVIKNKNTKILNFNKKK